MWIQCGLFWLVWWQRLCLWVVVLGTTVVLCRGWVHSVFYGGFHRSLVYIGDCSRFFCRVSTATVGSLLEVLLQAREYCDKGTLEFLQVNKWFIDGREKC